MDSIRIVIEGQGATPSAVSAFSVGAGGINPISENEKARGGSEMKSRLKEVPVGEAVGLVLAHDLTVIDPGKYKGPRFRKGHRIREEDIEELLRIGKEHVYVLELAEGELHEDEAAERIARSAAGSHLARTEPKEGKVN